MPKYFCEYCEIYLIHSGPWGRKQHNSGKKHIQNKIEFYTKIVNGYQQKAIQNFAINNQLNMLNFTNKSMLNPILNMGNFMGMGNMNNMNTMNNMMRVNNFGMNMMPPNMSGLPGGMPTSLGQPLQPNLMQAVPGGNSMVQNVQPSFFPQNVSNLPMQNMLYNNFQGGNQVQGGVNPSSGITGQGINNIASTNGANLSSLANTNDSNNNNNKQTQNGIPSNININGVLQQPINNQGNLQQNQQSTIQNTQQNQQNTSISPITQSGLPNQPNPPNYFPFPHNQPPFNLMPKMFPGQNMQNMQNMQNLQGNPYSNPQMMMFQQNMNNFMQNIPSNFQQQFPNKFPTHLPPNSSQPIIPFQTGGGIAIVSPSGEIKSSSSEEKTSKQSDINKC